MDTNIILFTQSPPEERQGNAIRNIYHKFTKEYREICRPDKFFSNLVKWRKYLKKATKYGKIIIYEKSKLSESQGRKVEKLKY